MDRLFPCLLSTPLISLDKDTLIPHQFIWVLETARRGGLWAGRDGQSHPGWLPQPQRYERGIPSCGRRSVLAGICGARTQAV